MCRRLDQFRAKTDTSRVKPHRVRLYRKLGATSRGDAITRADELGLLDVNESPG